SDSEKFADQKAEFYWGLRMRFAAGDIWGLKDDKTIGQLSGLQYKSNSRGQIEIESKEQAAKRGVLSPDRAESMMLAFATQNKIYGVNEVHKELMALKPVGMAALMKPTMSDQQLTCPQCQATCVARANGQWRCGNCAYQWFGSTDKKPAGVTPGRSDLMQKGLNRSIRFEEN